MRSFFLRVPVSVSVLLPRAAAALALLSATAPGLARADAPILVDREALARKLGEYHRQLEALEIQARGNPGAAQLEGGLHSLDEQVRALDRDIRSLPAAPQSCNGVAVPPTVVVTTPDPRHFHHEQRVQVYENQPPPNYPPPAYPQPVPVPAPAPAQGYVPPPPAQMVTVDDDGVGALIEQIEDQSFANDKLRVLAEAASSNWFRVSHIERILPLFAFSNDKLKALEIISPRLVDRQNKFRIYNLFTFPNDKERAQKILAKY